MAWLPQSRLLPTARASPSSTLAICVSVLLSSRCCSSLTLPAVSSSCCCWVAASLARARIEYSCPWMSNRRRMTKNRNTLRYTGSTPAEAKGSSSERTDVLGCLCYLSPALLVGLKYSTNGGMQKCVAAGGSHLPPEIIALRWKYRCCWWLSQVAATILFASSRLCTASDTGRRTGRQAGSGFARCA